MHVYIEMERPWISRVRYEVLLCVFQQHGAEAALGALSFTAGSQSSHALKLCFLGLQEYMQKAQDLVENESILLQTLGKLNLSLPICSSVQKNIKFAKT